MRTRYISYFFSLLVISLISCKQDIKAQLIRKWKMKNEDFSLDIRKDGSYIYNEHNKERAGQWELKEDKTLYLEGESFTIKKINEKQLLLETGSGEEMNFRTE